MMAKKFYTEKDIEDLFKSGIMTLEAGQDVVLTELAFEKTKQLGMKLVLDQPENPPSAPVRPYISRKQNSSSSAGSSLCPRECQSGERKEVTALKQRIRTAVNARLGSQVEETLLEAIIQRVMNQVGNN